MPLVGVLDPSHTEAAKSRMGRYPAWVDLGEALTRADASPKWAPWTWELLNAMFAEHQERGDRISSSALTSWCPRAEVIARKADYIGSLPDLYVPFRGTMVHRTMELYAHENALAEYRFFSTLKGIDISCSPDHLTATVLTDYKVTDNPPMYNSPYRHHTEQVELNAYITRHATKVEGPTGLRHDFESLPFDPRAGAVSRVQLVYMTPKQPKVMVVEQTEEAFNAKTGKFRKEKVPFVWPDRYVEKVFGERIETFAQALATFPDFPAGAEKVWGGDASYRCPGPPLCSLPSCLAKRWPDNLMWRNHADSAD